MPAPIWPSESATFRAVKGAIFAGLLRVSSHALKEAEAERVTLQQIEAASAAGECIEDYPTDP